MQSAIDFWEKDQKSFVQMQEFNHKPYCKDNPQRNGRRQIKKYGRNCGEKKE